MWSYDPRHGRLRLEVFVPVNPDPEGATAVQPDGPDNITVNPWGGLVLAEDGIGAQHLVAVSARGGPSMFARNAVSDSEFTGVKLLARPEDALREHPGRRLRLRDHRSVPARQVGEARPRGASPT